MIKEITSFTFNGIIIKPIRIINKTVKLNVFYSEDNKIVFDASSESLKKLFIKVVDGNIMIQSDFDNFYFNEDIRIDIYAHDLEEIRLDTVSAIIEGASINYDCDFRLSGATSITVNDLNGDDYDISTSGASKFVLNNVKADTVSVKMSGACLFKASGETDSFNIKASGACKIECEELTSKDINLNLSGACRANVKFVDLLDAKASGTTNIIYYTDFGRVEKEISGISVIKQG